jgi:S-adenosylmethionine:tRNA ribosyltransferase-isomerase
VFLPILIPYDRSMRTEDFDYELPAELIAQTPIEPRDASRLLVLDKRTGGVEHARFSAIGDYLRPNDLLVLNETRVLRARLRGRLVDGNGAAEALLLRRIDAERWEALVRPGRRLGPGRGIRFGEIEAVVEAVVENGARVLRFPPGTDPESMGETPLPPYIHTPLADPERYQTVYASVPGSAAAPTAGLHFTPELLASLRDRGVRTTTVLLHVGPGTFRPVTVEDPRQHPMHAEWYQIDAEACAAINQTRAAGGRVIAVGTTSVRVLEQAGVDAADRPLRPGSGWTRLLILPGHRFAVVDALVTNFHLPRSTLLMLVSALAGREHILAAYREAVARRYRFFSFGDAMLIA